MRNESAVSSADTSARPEKISNRQAGVVWDSGKNRQSEHWRELLMTSAGHC